MEKLLGWVTIKKRVMKIIQKSIMLEEHNYYTTHLDIINPFIPTKLTEMERKVLGMFMSFEGKLAEKDRFDTSFRKEVRLKLGISPGGLGNYIRAFKDKEVITEGLDGKLIIKQYLFPESKEQFYQFKITKDENSELE